MTDTAVSGMYRKKPIPVACAQWLAHGDDPDVRPYLGHCMCQEPGDQLTCNACSHAPAVWVAAVGRTNADRTPAAGHVLRLLCGECAVRSKEICDRGGRAVTFIRLGAAGVPGDGG